MIDKNYVYYGFHTYPLHFTFSFLRQRANFKVAKIIYAVFAGLA